MIILDQVHALLINLWIEKCGGTWDGRIVLAVKPHQEHIQNIGDFIRIICFSYTKLNGIIKPIDFHIPCCGDAISKVGAGPSTTWII